MSNNGISIIPETLCDCYRLRVLDLSFNYIKILPAAFQDMRNLVSLDISNNQEPRIGGYGCLVTMLVPMCVGPPGLGLRGLISAVFSEIRKDKSKAGHYM